MAKRVIPFDATAHQAAEALLPWFVNGTLEGPELTLVQRHLPECGRCQRELEWLRKFQAAYVESSPASPEASQAFRRLQNRLDCPPPWRRFARRAFATRAGQPAWAPWLAAAEFAVIVTLGALLWIARPPEAPYHTLGAAPASPVARGDVVIVFKPQSTVGQMQRVLQEAKAIVVAGPSASGAYLLQLPSENRKAALQQLRDEPAVVSLQSVGP